MLCPFCVKYNAKSETSTVHLAGHKEYHKQSRLNQEIGGHKSALSDHHSTRTPQFGRASSGICDYRNQNEGIIYLNYEAELPFPIPTT